LFDDIESHRKHADGHWQEYLRGQERKRIALSKVEPEIHTHGDEMDAGDEEVGDEEVSDEEVSDEEVSDEEVGDEEVGDEEAGDGRRYCICQSASYGDMVACGNEQCPFEWFHWGCVGLKAEPMRTWFCPICTEERKIEFIEAGDDWKDWNHCVCQSVSYNDMVECNNKLCPYG
jgi:hypothetical protein